ncbi:MAG TPA: type II toxin-antitoxin system HicB family antitoxin [Candidatus Binatia bacterium]|jgi:predicted RNase H-like HicB family nuclease|nr:type II toxin-antitoxin system HicB family antitoxin [Candidatus Binatia bacterium]
MKHVIQFHVYKGDKYYIAEGLDLPVVTQAKSLDELAKNIEEAVSLHLADEDPADYSLIAQPSVMLNMELDSLSYA